MVDTAINVSSAAELMAALESAQGGETIVLAPGSYGELNLYDERETFVKFASEVTITSSDPNDLATFERMTLRGVENLAFDAVNFDYDAAPGTAEYDKPFLIRESDSIAIRNSVFEGDLAEGVSDTLDGHPTGHGLSVNDSSNISVDNNEFYNWLRAATFGNVSTLAVTNNEVFDIRGDGFNFAAVTGGLIEGNYLHDFYGVTDFHRDMIQFWTNGTTSPSTDIIIRANVLDAGVGDWTQSIFMRNEEVDTGRAGLEMYYQNILVEGNVIHNGHSHGITVGETLGLTIRSNTLLHNQDSGDGALVHVPTINVKDASQDVVIADNIVPRLSVTSADGRVVENNVVVQRSNPDGDNYVGDLFANALAGANATLDDLKALPDGLIQQLGAGSWLTRFDTTPEDLTGFIINEAGSGLGLQTHALDASALYGPSGAVDLTGAEVVWDFGDGNTGTGVRGSYTWQEAGTYDVSAVVTLADGETASLRKTIVVQTPLALDADFNAGADDLSDMTNAVTVGSEVTFEGEGSDLAARLNGGVVTYARNAELVNNAEHSVIVDFKKDPGSEASEGTLVYFSSSFVISVGADGLSVMVGTDQGGTTIKASNVGITDADWHRLAVTFSGKDGAAILYLDGAEVGRVSGLDGAIQTGSSSHDLHIGNPFDGTKSFPGLIDNFQFWKGAMSAEQIEALSVRAEDGKFVPLEGTKTDPVDDGSSDPVDDGSSDPVDDGSTDPVDDGSTDPVDDGSTDPVDDGSTVPPGKSEPIPENRGGGWKDKDATVKSGASSPEDGAELLTASYGGAGDDVIRGTGGNDRLVGRDGNDVLLGRMGDDQLVGGGDNDRLAGGSGNDVLLGRLGDDRLVGGGGNDRLAGGDGNDVLVGGLGRDVLTGGQGADAFKFKDASESLPGAADRIADFSSSQGDQIRLGGIDANVNAAGNDSFVFIDTAVFSGNAGELRYFVNPHGHAIVRGDTDGDGQADFQLIVTDTSILQANDFNL